MKKMPELVELRKKIDASQLVIVGINFDDDPEKARAAIQQHGWSWPQVHAKTSAQGQEEFWEQITGITSLPRAFLVDPEGILRLDFRPHDIEKKIQPWIGSAKDRENKGGENKGGENRERKK